MAELGSVAALLLAGVFAWAGLAKGLRPQRTATAFAALGVPVSGLAARLVPATELGLAVLLVARPRLGGLAALALLAAFSAWLRHAQRSGAVAGCGCFGGGATRPASPRDLVRNALLAALALGVAGLEQPVGPTLPAVVAVSVLATTGAVVLALVDLRLRTGRLWDNRLDTGPGARP